MAFKAISKIEFYCWNALELPVDCFNGHPAVKGTLWKSTGLCLKFAHFVSLTKKYVMYKLISNAHYRIVSLAWWVLPCRRARVHARETMR